jgi:hypothetical protein
VLFLLLQILPQEKKYRDSKKEGREGEKMVSWKLRRNGARIMNEWGDSVPWKRIRLPNQSSPLLFFLS